MIQNNKFQKNQSKQRSVSQTFITRSLIEPEIAIKQKKKLKIANLTLIDKSSYKKQSFCTVCIRNFTKTFRQHHCRICSNAICGDCSFGRVNNERACDMCYLKFSNLQQEERRKKTLDTYRILCGYLIYKKNIKMDELQQIKTKVRMNEQINEQKQKQSQDLIIRNLKSQSLNLQETKKFILLQLSNIIEQNKKLEENIQNLQRQSM